MSFYRQKHCVIFFNAKRDSKNSFFTESPQVNNFRYKDDYRVEIRTKDHDMITNPDPQDLFSWFLKLLLLYICALEVVVFIDFPQIWYNISFYNSLNKFVGQNNQKTFTRISGVFFDFKALGVFKKKNYFIELIVIKTISYNCVSLAQLVYVCLEMWVSASYSVLPYGDVTFALLSVTCMYDSRVARTQYSC